MIDLNGFPGTQGEDGKFDGGDTAAIVGTILALIGDDKLDWCNKMKLIYLRNRLLRDGLPMRHPDESRWYGQTDRFSRDQLTATLCGAIETDSFFRDYLFRAHRKRFFLTAWNTKRNGAMDVPYKFPDVTLFEVWALWIRCYKPWWARLVLWLFDIETLIGAVHWRFFRKDRVTRNHMLVMIQGMRHLPTIPMRLAYYISDWCILIGRWDSHCKAVREFNTASLFMRAVWWKK